MPDHRDTWSSGNAYEPYVGRWSRLAAREFLRWLDAPESLRWLDVGCGTGALSEAIVARCSPDAVVGVDRSEEYLEYARARVTDPRVSFRLGDAQALPVKDREHDIVVSGLVLNFVPDLPAALAEMMRALSPGGTVAAYVWDYAGEMQMMRRFWDAAVALDPPALELDEGRRFPDRAARAAGRALRVGAASRRCACSRSTFRRSSRTSTTTGPRSSAARPRRPDTACRSPKSGALRSASGSDRRCRSGPTAASISSPARGRSAA